jgi:hypothetical protein
MERFLDHIAGFGLLHEETKTVMTRKELEEQISFCATLGYVVVLEDERKQRLRPTDRVNQELLFLERIAGLKKPPTVQQNSEDTPKAKPASLA